MRRRSSVPCELSWLSGRAFAFVFGGSQFQSAVCLICVFSRLMLLFLFYQLLLFYLVQYSFLFNFDD